VIAASVRRMTQTARCERLRSLCAELSLAADQGETARVSSLDHAVRSAVMAMLGEGAPTGEGAGEELAALTAALAALEASVGKMRALQGKVLRDDNARALYLTRSNGRRTS